MIKIRYHHLMCIPRYEGKGYSDAFCSNMQKIKEAIQKDNYVLVEECDDVCRFCPNNQNGHCIDAKKVNRYDSTVKQKLEKNEPLSPAEICSDCRWFEICKKIK